MPIAFEQRINSSVSLCVWQILETEEFFFEHLNLLPEDESLIRQLKLPVRRLEKLACRLALATLLHRSDVHVSYTAGAPSIPDCAVSFSHSRSYVAVAINTCGKIGVDIEPVSDRILQLYPKFLQDSEILQVDTTNPHDLHFYWGAKEAMYKFCGGVCANFKSDILISPSHGQADTKGIIQTRNQSLRVQLSYYELDNMMIVVCF